MINCLNTVAEVLDDAIESYGILTPTMNFLTVLDSDMFKNLEGSKDDTLEGILIEFPNAAPGFNRAPPALMLARFNRS